ncbi:hypothetical protein [Paraburkholderia phenoliruptrix]|uniref:DUF5625 domain-containing protein n=2 Tax=Paraburkholderia phenoliruptrix TaxID=252970 RepID=A0ABV3WDY8_9BURK|nr:hypothetical protein [Paraburkholderia phenoliruptrix]MDR6392384.1 hypothetical protein [Paraburkholderia phenoliruptrix]
MYTSNGRFAAAMILIAMLKKDRSSIRSATVCGSPNLLLNTVLAIFIERKTMSIRYFVALLFPLVSACSVLVPDMADENQGLKGQAAESLEKFYGTYQVSNTKGHNWDVSAVTVIRGDAAGNNLPLFRLYRKDGRQFDTITPRVCETSSTHKKPEGSNGTYVRCGLTGMMSNAPFLIFDSFPMTLKSNNFIFKEKAFEINPGEYHLFLSYKNGGSADFELVRVSEGSANKPAVK